MANHIHCLFQANSEVLRPHWRRHWHHPRRLPALSCATSSVAPPSQLPVDATATTAASRLYSPPLTQRPSRSAKQETNANLKLANFVALTLLVSSIILHNSAPTLARNQATSSDIHSFSNLTSGQNGPRFRRHSSQSAGSAELHDCSDCVAVPVVAIWRGKQLNGANVLVRQTVSSSNQAAPPSSHFHQQHIYHHTQQPNYETPPPPPPKARPRPLEPKSDHKCPMTGPLTVCEQIDSYPADVILEKLEVVKKNLKHTYFNIDSLFSDERDHSSDPFEPAPDARGQPPPPLIHTPKHAANSTIDYDYQQRDNYQSQHQQAERANAHISEFYHVHDHGHRPGGGGGGHGQETQTQTSSHHYSQQQQQHKWQSANGPSSDGGQRQIQRATSRPMDDVVRQSDSQLAGQATDSNRWTKHRRHQTSTSGANSDEFLHIVEHRAITSAGINKKINLMDGAARNNYRDSKPLSIDCIRRRNAAAAAAAALSRPWVGSNVRRQSPEEIKHANDELEYRDQIDPMILARESNDKTSKVTPCAALTATKVNDLQAPKMSSDDNVAHSEPLLATRRTRPSGARQRRITRRQVSPVSVQVNVNSAQPPATPQPGDISDPITSTPSPLDVDTPPPESPIPRQSPVCQARSIYISPKVALNDKKQWKYVVNAQERNPRIKQIIRVDVCEDPFGPCSDQVTLPFGFISQCKQKYAKKKLLALDAESGLLEVDTFFIPSCCVCQLIADSRPSRPMEDKESLGDQNSDAEPPPDSSANISSANNN